MLKLKILNKLPVLKLKCTSKFPDVVLANLQEKEVTPTKEIQEVIADKPYDGLSKVIVNEYIPVVDNKTITKNGVYNAVDDNLDGYSSVDVQTFGVDINEYFDTIPSKNQTNILDAIKKVPTIDMINLTDAQGFFRDLTLVESIKVLNTSNIENFSSFANSCSNLLQVSDIDTSNAQYITHMFYSCSKLSSLPLFDFGKVIQVGTHFVNFCMNLTDLGGFKNLGKGYTTKTANDSNCQLYLINSSKLTHDSLMNVINNLYDLNLTYDVANGGTLYTQKLVLGSTNLAKLTAEEIAIATNKGWTVS